MLLQDHVEVGAAEAEGAHAGEAPPAFGLPGLGPGLDLERHRVEGHVGAALVEVDAGRQDLVVQGQRRLDGGHRASGALEVTDLALHGADADRPPGAAATGADDLAQRVDLDLVADDGAGAVALDQVQLDRVDASVGVGPAQGALLALDVRGGDALALAVGAGADALDHRVDPVAVALGFGQALEHQDGSALAHDEAVGGLVEGGGVVGGERPDLAELDVGGHAHHAIDAAGDGDVVVAVLEALHRGLDGGHRAGAGGVHGEVRAAQVEGVGDAPGDDVGQLAGHGVFGDRRQIGLDRLAEALGDAGPLGCGQRGVARDLLQGGQDLRGADAQGVVVGDLTAHRVAQDDGDPRAVHAAVVVENSGVAQGLAHGVQGQLLHGVDELRDLRGDAVLPGLELVVLHEAADAGVGLVRGSPVGVVVLGGVPALDRHLAEAVHAALDVVPEHPDVRGLGHVHPDADDGHGVAIGDRGVLGDQLGGQVPHQGSPRPFEGLGVADHLTACREQRSGWRPGDGRPLPDRHLPEHAGADHTRRLGDVRVAVPGPQGRRGPHPGAAGELRPHGGAGDRPLPPTHGGAVGPDHRREAAVPASQRRGESQSLARGPGPLDRVVGGEPALGDLPGVLAGGQAAHHGGQGAGGDAEAAHDPAVGVAGGPDPAGQLGGAVVLQADVDPPAGQLGAETQLGQAEDLLPEHDSDRAEGHGRGGGGGAQAGVEDRAVPVLGEELQAVGGAAVATGLAAAEQDAGVAAGHGAGLGALEPGRAAPDRGAALGQDDRAVARGLLAGEHADPGALGHGVHRATGQVDDRGGASGEHGRGQTGPLRGEDHEQQGLRHHSAPGAQHRTQVRRVLRTQAPQHAGPREGGSRVGRHQAHCVPS